MTRPALPRCSITSESLGEPTMGTAPEARGWLVVEQPGPWGREAATESRLDPALGAALAAHAGQAGWRLVLVRAAGQHAQPRAGAGPATRRVMLAGTEPGHSWLEQAEFDLSPDGDRALAGLLERPLVPGFGTPVAGPVLLVCTNGRRDLCCALRGRPLVTMLCTRLPDGQVWESSHLGGHRFAPTALVLPHGLMYGRLTLASALGALEAAGRGRVVLDGYRGRSTWSRPAQAAEAAVREAAGVLDADALAVLTERGLPGADGDQPRVDVLVGHADGRRWQVVVGRTVGPEVRAESCGKAGVPLASWAPELVRAAGRGRG